MTYQLNEKEIKWCDDYLKARYVGLTSENYARGNYETRCNLYFKDINNFIQNVGRYSDLTILKICEYGEIEPFLNTYGTFVNCIRPEIPYDLRTSNETQAEINYMAKRVCEARGEEGLYPEPLPKINTHIKAQFGEEAMKQNIEFMENVQKEIALEQVESESVMEMQM